MRLVTIGLLLLCACVAEDHGSGVFGTRADMRTPAGDYTGYRVITECEGQWTDVGVIGFGSRVINESNELADYGQEMYWQVLSDIPSIWGWGGYGLACQSGVGTQVYLDNWRHVDGVIARVGTFLRDNDLNFQVAISVGGPPVAQAE